MPPDFSVTACNDPPFSGVKVTVAPVIGFPPLVRVACIVVVPPEDIVVGLAAIAMVKGGEGSTVILICPCPFV